MFHFLAIIIIIITLFIFKPPQSHQRCNHFILQICLTGGAVSDILQEGTSGVITNTYCAELWDTMPIYDGDICIRSPTSTACGVSSIIFLGLVEVCYY